MTERDERERGRRVQGAAVQKHPMEEDWNLKNSKSRIIWSDRVTVNKGSGAHKGMPVE